jgi:hypothetical protein
MRQLPSHLSGLLSELSKIETIGACSLIAKSDEHKRLTVKGRNSKIPLPSWAVGLYSITRMVVSVNNDYAKAVNNQIKANGLTPDFQAEESKISRPIEEWPNAILREGLKNPDQLYVRVFTNMVKTNMVKFFFNSLGENVTDLISDDFRAEYMTLPKIAVKQVLHGVAKEVEPREYLAENIIYLKKGDACFNNLSSDLYKLFDLE